MQPSELTITAEIKAIEKANIQPKKLEQLFYAPLEKAIQNPLTTEYSRPTNTY